jgi:hypothetical protein
MTHEHSQSRQKKKSQVTVNRIYHKKKTQKKAATSTKTIIDSSRTARSADYTSIPMIS